MVNLNIIQHIKEKKYSLFFKELFKFLSEPNELVELNLSSTDIDFEKVYLLKF